MKKVKHLSEDYKESPNTLIGTLFAAACTLVAVIYLLMADWS